MTPTARAQFLLQLVDVGYGESICEVEKYLVDRSLDDLMRAGVLQRIKRPEPKHEPEVQKKKFEPVGYGGSVDMKA